MCPLALVPGHMRMRISMSVREYLVLTCPFKVAPETSGLLSGCQLLLPVT